MCIMYMHIIYRQCIILKVTSGLCFMPNFEAELSGWMRLCSVCHAHLACDFACVRHKLFDTSLFNTSLFDTRRVTGLHLAGGGSGDAEA
jgi:hypothetical protein